MWREGITLEAMYAMFATIERQWTKSDRDADAVGELCGWKARKVCDV